MQYSHCRLTAFLLFDSCVPCSLFHSLFFCFFSGRTHLSVNFPIDYQKSRYVRHTLNKCLYYDHNDDGDRCEAVVTTTTSAKWNSDRNYFSHTHKHTRSKWHHKLNPKLFTNVLKGWHFWHFPFLVLSLFFIKRFTLFCRLTLVSAFWCLQIRLLCTPTNKLCHRWCDAMSWIECEDPHIRRKYIWAFYVMPIHIYYHTKLIEIEIDD